VNIKTQELGEARVRGDGVGEFGQFLDEPRHKHSLDSTTTSEPTMLLQVKLHPQNVILGQNQLQNEVGWNEMSPFYFSLFLDISTSCVTTQNNQSS